MIADFSFLNLKEQLYMQWMHYICLMCVRLCVHVQTWVPLCFVYANCLRCWHAGIQAQFDTVFIPESNNMIYLWKLFCLSVCMSVCLSVCLPDSHLSIQSAWLREQDAALLRWCYGWKSNTASNYCKNKHLHSPTEH